MIHIDKIDGYQIFTHNPKAEDISEGIHQIRAMKKTGIKVKLSAIKQDIIEEAIFEKRCTFHFERSFETLAKEAPLILPCKEPEKFKGIVKTMAKWCQKTNKSSNIKGLVLHSFNIHRHLKHFGHQEEALTENLEITNFSEALIIVVYNPQENVLLLIRNAECHNLAADIRFGLDDLKMFILLFHDRLKNSNLKLISLVVIDKARDYTSECCDCINNVFLSEELEDITKFENVWEERATHYQKENVENINPDFIKSFLAAITGTIAATFIYGKFLPTLTDKSDEQITNLKVLLTKEQMEIIYSEHRHIIIKGGFGCGKTMVAAALLTKISESLEIDEKIYYICYDSRTELLHQMTKHSQDKHVENVILFRNEERRQLSEIIKDILGKNESTRKVNFLVDEYDGEDLDESEAERLNKVFNGLLKKAFVTLIVQPIEIHRVINKIRQSRNRFELLTNMKCYQLNRVMRNSVEIHNLVRLTTEVLRKQQTVFIHQEKSETAIELKNGAGNKSVSVKDNVNKFRHYITAKLSSREKDFNEYSKKKHELHGAKVVPGFAKEAGCNDTHEYSEICPNIPKLTLDEALDISGVIKKTVGQKFELDGANAVSETSKGSFYRDTDQYQETNHFIPKLGLDEAQAVTGFIHNKGAGGVKTISQFIFNSADKTGHNIKSRKPAFFELGDKSDIQKVLSLIAIFEERKIGKGEQVVLHFDTGSNEIPAILLFIFANHFKILEKVTKKYKEFQHLKKSVLVCSFPTFRGLEHPKITVVIDCDIYYMQHYLVETLARCTSDLCVVVLQNSSTVKKITSEWKSKQAIQQWKIKIYKETLQHEDFELEIRHGINNMVMNAKFETEYYKKLEKKYAVLLTKDEICEFENKFDEARKIINER